MEIIDERPGEASASDTITLLVRINEGSPEQSARLREFIAAGLSPNQILSCCNELGECVYTGPEDPNSYTNRFRSQWRCDLSEILSQPLSEGPAQIHYPPHFSLTPESIIDLRELEALSCQEDPEISLVTHADYMHYFEQFHPEQLRQILLNLFKIDMVDGCPAPCFKMCGFATSNTITRWMPPETVRWVIAEKTSIQPESVLRLNLFDRSDLKYYVTQDEDGRTITSVDMLRFYRDHTGKFSPASISYGRDKYTVDFIFQILREGLPLFRISRLATGNQEGDLEALEEKVAERFEAAGLEYTDGMREKINKAFEIGSKEGVDIHLGNAITPEMTERDITTSQYFTYHSVTLSPNGFSASVVRPPSAAYPRSHIRWPLIPGTTLRIPMVQSGEDFPATLDPKRRGIIFGPKYIEVTPNGDVRDGLEVKTERSNEADFLERFFYDMKIYEFEIREFYNSDEYAQPHEGNSDQFVDSRSERLNLLEGISPESHADWLCNQLTAFRRIILERWRLFKEYGENDMAIFHMTTAELELSYATYAVMQSLQERLNVLLTPDPYMNRPDSTEARSIMRSALLRSGVTPTEFTDLRQKISEVNDIIMAHEDRICELLHKNGQCQAVSGLVGLTDDLIDKMFNNLKNIMEEG